MPAKSHKAELEAIRNSKQSDLERALEGRNEHAFELKRILLEQSFRALSGPEALSADMGGDIN